MAQKKTKAVSELKVGDHVVASDSQIGTGYSTVREDNGRLFLVDFGVSKLNGTRLHDGHGIPHTGTCWWVTKDDLKLSKKHYLKKYKELTR